MSQFYIGTIYGSKPGTLADDPDLACGMLSIKMPQQDMTTPNAGYSEVLDFEYGGADVVAASQSHRRYEFSWSGKEVSDFTSVDQIKRLASGEYGTGLIYFADPYNYRTNLLPPAWASPSLIKSGWRSIYDSPPTNFDPIAWANDTNQPRLSPTFNITSTAGQPPSDARSICVLPVPPTHTLHLGFSATATGSAVIRVRPIKRDGTYDTPVDLTLISWLDTLRMNTTFDGSTYQAVEVYFTRTSSADSTLTVTSGMAQLLPTGDAQSVSIFHSGQGNTGCKFETNAIEEQYTYTDMRRNYRIKGISATLIEVGTSARYA